MKMNINSALAAIYRAGLSLDASLGLPTQYAHGLRVAMMCMAVARELGFSEARLSSLMVCGLLHDICSPPSLKTIGESNPSRKHLQEHCREGQRLLELLPLSSPINGFILYHHEMGDGSGPFGKSDFDEIPFEASLIALCGTIEMSVDFNGIGTIGLPQLQRALTGPSFARFNPRATQALAKVLDGGLLHLLRDDLLYAFRLMIPDWYVSLDNMAMYKLGFFAARLVGAQSDFTRTHSLQVANAFWLLGRERGYDSKTLAEFFLAGCLHDCGKLSLSGKLLDRNGSFDDLETQIMQSHVFLSNVILRSIAGDAPICAWASNHHERLDGSGYPHGLRATELDEPSQLMAVCDVYEAASANRPYHAARGPRQMRSLIFQMADQGKLNADMCEQACNLWERYPDGKLPTPWEVQGKALV